MNPPNQKNQKPALRAQVTRGSGNVFADLGFPAGEAADLEVKAELTRQIRNGIESLGLTQMQVAGLLRLSQPDVSKLMSGRHAGYSVDRLIAILTALEVDVDIVLRPRRNHGQHKYGVVRVKQILSVSKAARRAVKTA
jgi:predicted XRE-type DNA-binding protein